MKSFGDILSYQISPNVGQRFVLFKKLPFYVTNCFNSFLGNFGENWTIFNSSIWSHCLTQIFWANQFFVVPQKRRFHPTIDADSFRCKSQSDKSQPWFSRDNCVSLPVRSRRVQWGGGWGIESCTKGWSSQISHFVRKGHKCKAGIKFWTNFREEYLLTMLCWNKAIWLDVISWKTYVSLKYVYDTVYSVTRRKIIITIKISP